jgi:hypothetical protein
MTRPVIPLFGLRRLRACASQVAVVVLVIGGSASSFANEPSTVKSGNADSKPARAKPGKAGNGLLIVPTIVGARTTGARVNVELQINGISDSAGAQFRWTSEGPVQLDGPTEVVLASGASQRLVIPLHISGAGASYLNLFSTHAGRSSVVSVPIVIDAESLTRKQTASPTLLPSGERIILLPSR